MSAREMISAIFYFTTGGRPMSLIRFLRLEGAKPVYLFRDRLAFEFYEASTPWALRRRVFSREQEEDLPFALHHQPDHIEEVE